MKTKFYKYQAIGNDYIVLDPVTFNQPLNPNIIQKICDRKYGVGADGILYGPTNKNNNLSVKIFNPDGSEAEKSGNGIRIFSRYLFDRKYIKNNSFLLHTKGGMVQVLKFNQSASEIQVDMGQPAFDTHITRALVHKSKTFNQLLGVDDYLQTIDYVSMGNPHCVIFSDQISKQITCKLGVVIENYTLFPNKTNVQFAKVVNQHTIQLEIWERGAGYTLSSGSSSCAVVAVAIKKGLTQSPVVVCMPGGRLTISQSGTGSMLMKGEVSGVIMHGYIHTDML